MFFSTVFDLGRQSVPMSEERLHEGGLSQSTQSTQSTLSPSQDMESCSQSKPRSQPASGSSSGPTTSSQSSSGSGTLSSVDTIPVTLPSVPEEPEAEPWGRLLPMAIGFRSHGGCASCFWPPSVPPRPHLFLGFALFAQTVWRMSTSLVGAPSVTTFWMIRTTKGPRCSKSTARSTSRSSE